MTTIDTFDGRDVVQTSVAVTNAGDGLSQSLAVDPREIHIGDTGVIALEYVCTKVGFVEIKDTDCLNRVATLKAGTATLIDRDIVAEALDAQALKIEEAKGLQRIPFESNGDDDDGGGELYDPATEARIDAGPRSAGKRHAKRDD